MIERAIAARSEAADAFFDAEAAATARCCLRMAERFAAGGRLIALGADPAGRSDARHVAVEFVHPVIVGKRALPAIALSGEGGPLDRQLDGLADAGDIVIGFGLDREAAGPESGVGRALEAAARAGCMTIAYGGKVRAADAASAADAWSFEVPSTDAAIRQEVIETHYHVLWELVHVFFDHRGLLEGRGESRRHDAGASSFLYPFLAESETNADAVLADVEASVLVKAQQVADLRARTLREGEAELRAAAAALRTSFEAGGRMLAFGNGGSATDAIDAVADFRVPHDPELPPRPALDLTEDTAVITAIANDIGVAEIFQRQVIAHGRSGDVALAFSTSGGSENVLAGLAEARRRGLATIAMLGYDGGRVAAEGLADHVIICRSQDIPRIQEAQASACHVLRGLVEAG